VEFKKSTESANELTFGIFGYNHFLPDRKSDLHIPWYWLVCYLGL